MLFRIDGLQHTGLASSAPAAKPADPHEVFSVSLDREMLQALAVELKKLGLDTSRLEAPNGQGRQVSVNHAAGRQIFAAAELPPAPRAEDASPSTPEASKPGFVPQFQQDAKVLSLYGDVWNLNPAFYATRETAEWMAHKYGTGEVVEVPYGTPGSPFSSTATQFHIKLNNGRLVNAGLLADYYRGIPEAKFPGLADREIRDQLIKDYGSDALPSAG
jgi:hypothetical protein